jgi:superfamily II DNA helicase RecQ
MVVAAEYRPSIIELTAIRSLRTQFVYLTATLPPSMRAEFEERNYLYHPKVIRASSNRPNIFYMVRKIDARAGSLLKQAAVEAKEAWTDSGFFDHAHDKIILNVRTCKDADDLADLLGCSSYTAESGTPAEKKQILDRWTQAHDTPYIVATTALAEGFDYPHVRLVMNVDEPESLQTHASKYLLYIFRRNNLIGSRSARRRGDLVSPTVGNAVRTSARGSQMLASIEGP